MGGSCSYAEDCESGFCAGGVCCASACNGTCQACAQGTGTCAVVTGAEDPDTCAGTKTCDGTGACKLKIGQAATDPTSCVSGFASDGYCCNSACAGACDACGQALGATANGTCTVLPAGNAGQPACGNGFACDGVSASCPGAPCVNDADCLPVDYCSTSGACVARHTQGQACNTTADCKVTGCRECQTGFCTDGVCCDGACSGQCQACDVAPNPGTCTTVTGKPHGARTACAGAGAMCGGTCNGINAAACSYPTVSCGSTCADGAQSSDVCDGMGTCKKGTPMPCAGGYACDGTTKCKTSCAADGDCLAGYACSGSKCSPTGGAKCSDDGLSSVTSAGTVSCGPYRCDASSGTCRHGCSSVSDCAAGNVCDETSLECARPRPPIR